MKLILKLFIVNLNGIHNGGNFQILYEGVMKNSRFDQEENELVSKDVLLPGCESK